MTTTGLRAAFPLLGEAAFLNAGSAGPVPAAAIAAARAELERELVAPRGKAHFEHAGELADALRARYADVLGAHAADVALTTSTTDGIGRVLAALDYGPGDELLAADDEHPGVVGPLAAQRARGVSVRLVPATELAAAAGPSTRLIACSHVSWMSGAIAPVAELVATGVPVLLDGAQGVGAIPVDVAGLGCAAYAGSGQKWLCGAEGTGMLYVAPELRARLRPRTPGYTNLADPAAGIESPLQPDARALDAPALSPVSLTWSLAALDVLERPGWPAVHARAAGLAAQAAAALADAGWQVRERGETTLVAWRRAGAEEESARLAEQGIFIRWLPGGELLRASFGAWNDERDLERLVAALGRPDV